MNKVQGFAYRHKRAIQQGKCVPLPVPYDDSAYRHRCMVWDNAFRSAINCETYRKNWRDTETVISEGYCLDSSL